jgi:hypothetical protein
MRVGCSTLKMRKRDRPCNLLVVIESEATGSYCRCSTRLLCGAATGGMPLANCIHSV